MGARPVEELKIAALKSSGKLGKKVDESLMEYTNSPNSFLVNVDEPRFNNGEGKTIYRESVRGMNLFIVGDVGNHSIKYKLHGKNKSMGPDEIFTDIKSAKSAEKNHAASVHAVVPLLPYSRQHKINGKESSNCAMGLIELENMGVDSVITYDPHDPRVELALRTASFEKLHATHPMLLQILRKEEINPNKLMVIAPDLGAAQRATYYADLLGVPVGFFNKRRNQYKVVDGHAPVEGHEYLGPDLKDMDLIVPDDMIDTGGTMLKIIEEAKNRGARNIYIVSTFIFLCKGLADFNAAFAAGLIKRVYSTNLSYLKPSIKSSKWFSEVDCSPHLAKTILKLHGNHSLESMLNGKEEIYNEMEKIRNKVKIYLPNNLVGKKQAAFCDTSNKR